ncbi:MAG: hypothetical protein N3D75_03300 [Candidatus Aenigmarchaeota archaeon]|nr:hypothetical protein [Candidatus Aenigmarchaeota archaeon]
MRYFVVLLAIIIIPLANAQEYKLKYAYYPKDMVIESGKSNETLVVFENLHNETVYNVKINFVLPQGFSANHTIIEEMEQKQKKSTKISISTNAKNGTYNITIWAESIETVSGIKVQSPKYNFTVNVTGYNLSLATTTTTVVTTTVTATQATTIKEIANTTTTLEKISNEERSKRLVFIIPAIIAVLVIGFIILSR